MAEGVQGVGRPAGASFSPRPREPESPFALGETPRTWRNLLDDAALLVSRGIVSRGAEVMVACNDRYLQTVVSLACWRAGGVAALPPNGRQETIDGLCAARGISLVVHDGGGTGGLDVRPLLEEAGAQGPGASTGALEALVFAADQPLVCVYTSGSTGQHVACRKTARQLLGEAEVLARLFDVGPGARVLATVPPHHIYGLLFGVLVPFMGGGAFLRSTPLQAVAVVAQAREYGATVLVSVPAHLRGLAEGIAGELPPTRRIFSSGAALEPRVAVRVALATGRAVTEILGSTETGGIAWREAAADDAGATAPQPADALWRPLPGVRVEAGADEATGGAIGGAGGGAGGGAIGGARGGAIVVWSPFAETSPYVGADRVRLAADGRFAWLGRADGVVKIGGSRVAAAEIERLLRELPDVRDAAVVAVETGGARGHELWAAVETTTQSVATLRAALLRRVETVAVPRRFRLVAALPREANGKLPRGRLLALFDTAPEAASAVVEPPVVEPEAHATTVPVPRDWKYFEGHFTHFPILAGVVQMNDIVLPQVRACWPRLGALRRITNLKFRAPIAPGDVLALQVKRRAANKIAFELRRGEKLVSSGALEFGAAPGPEARAE
jgi:acyl-coenzyme A synthetase/AMP-(fatty) acid ligase